ncbi:MAG: OmpA family protein, partial [Bacteroidales bacterium]
MSKRTDEDFTLPSFDLSISDMMAGFLMIFILLFSSTLFSLRKEFDRKNRIAEDYQSLQVELYNDLFKEFEKDLLEWNAEIIPESLIVRFKEPEVLFEPNSALLREQFKKILESFFPRYINILISPKYKQGIEEIRIEGHTAKSDIYTYFDHINLSQNRTNSVLFYIMNLPQLSPQIKEWAKGKIVASGLADSRPIEGDTTGKLSRRVEFR